MNDANPFVVAFVLYLVFIGCGDDEPIVEGGELSFNSLNDSYQGPRGTNVLISFQVSAEDGIQSLSATWDGGSEDFNVNSGSTSYQAQLTYSIPGDAVLNTEYNIDFELTGFDGDREVESTVVVVSPVIQTPSTYSFTRNNETTVDYPGQNDRLDQVEEIKAYLNSANGGAPVSAQVLEDAYSNANSDGNGFFSFSSSRQLKDKTFQPDLDEHFMETLFASAEAASITGAQASDGMAGLLVRENSGNTILVDENGREFTQLIEKGLMGTVMHNQIFNIYFSDARTGDEVENTIPREGENCTDMEHHWDEAFGYWNPPLDFTSNWPYDRGSEDRFWSHYSNVVDPYLGTNDAIMQAFINGRTAIVNNDLGTKNQERQFISMQLELVAAAVCVHYINSTLSAINEGKTGEAFHTLSEAWAFVNAIKYYPGRKLSLEEIDEIKESDFGAHGNFWNVTVEGLNKGKATLVAAYPDLEDSQDDL